MRFVVFFLIGLFPWTVIGQGVKLDEKFTVRQTNKYFKLLKKLSKYGDYNKLSRGLTKQNYSEIYRGMHFLNRWLADSSIIKLSVSPVSATPREESFFVIEPDSFSVDSDSLFGNVKKAKVQNRQFQNGKFFARLSFLFVVYEFPESLKTNSSPQGFLRVMITSIIPDRCISLGGFVGEYVRRLSPEEYDKLLSP